jgi:hypothetical protein
VGWVRGFRSLVRDSRPPLDGGRPTFTPLPRFAGPRHRPRLHSPRPDETDDASGTGHRVVKTTARGREGRDLWRSPKGDHPRSTKGNHSSTPRAGLYNAASFLPSRTFQEGGRPPYRSVHASERRPLWLRSCLMVGPFVIAGGPVVGPVTAEGMACYRRCDRGLHGPSSARGRSPRPAVVSTSRG